MPLNPDAILGRIMCVSDADWHRTFGFASRLLSNDGRHRSSDPFHIGSSAEGDCIRGASRRTAGFSTRSHPCFRWADLLLGRSLAGNARSRSDQAGSRPPDLARRCLLSRCRLGRIAFRRRRRAGVSRRRRRIGSRAVHRRCFSRRSFGRSRIGRRCRLGRGVSRSFVPLAASSERQRHHQCSENQLRVHVIIHPVAS